MEVTVRGMADPRTALDETLIQMVDEGDDRILVFTADLGTIVPKFMATRKNQFIEAGIAEANMLSTAAGLALCGYVPFIATLAAFAALKVCEQIKIDLAYCRANVKVVGCGGGTVYGTLGTTHMGLEDVGAMRILAGMTVVVPADAAAVRAFTRELAAYDGPCYMRIGRGKEPVIYGDDQRFTIGKGIRLTEGSDVAIIANGGMLLPALEASEILRREGIGARVIDMPTVKPLDRELVASAAAETGGIIAAEDHNVVGGLGSAVAEVLCETHPTRLVRIGVPDVFCPSGAQKDLWNLYGMTADSIAEAARGLVRGGPMRGELVRGADARETNLQRG